MNNVEKEKSKSVRHIDLSQIVQSIPKTDSARGVWAVFWWQNIPLGHISISARQLPLNPTQLAQIALPVITPAIEAYSVQSKRSGSDNLTLVQPQDGKNSGSFSNSDWFRDRLAWLDDLADYRPHVEGRGEISISLVIPTRNRPSMLVDCLNAVSKLTEKPDEIIVVDNAPDQSATREVVQRFKNMIYFPEPIVGASIARNTGVQQSSGEIIAFLDDDELVRPNWLNSIKRCFCDPGVSVVTGLVLPIELEFEAQVLFEQRFSFVRGYCRKIYDYQFYLENKRFGVPAWEIGGSGNLAIRRSVFDNLQGFDQRLGAGAAGCSEDSELFYNTLANGYRCDYEPNAVVYHRHRRDIQSLEQQSFNYMRGHVTALLIQFAKHRDFGNLVRLFGILPLVYLGYFVRGLTGDPAFSKRMLANEIRGCLSGLQYYRACR